MLLLRRLLVVLALALVLAAVASAAAPRNNQPPAIGGLAKVGSILVGSNGSWFCEPGCLSYSWRWLRCQPDGSPPCTYLTDPQMTDIEGNPIDNRSYTVSQADLGHAIRLEVAATNYDCNALGQDCRYSTSPGARSAPTAPVGAGPASRATASALGVYRSRYLPSLRASAEYRRWAKANPGEVRLIRAYAADRSQPPPRVATTFGRALAAVEEQLAWVQGVHP
jgi:hypothetical protein